MTNLLIEENGYCGFDPSRAVWASGGIHDLYNDCGLTSVLCDADFVFETRDCILLVEYKNAKVPEARVHATPDTEYNPFRSEKLLNIASKYYDSMHYLRLLGKNKPIRYVFVLEYPKGDTASRKALRNRLKKHLPFELQERLAKGIKLIESVDVVNIAEWNGDATYGQFPIKPVSANPAPATTVTAQR